MVSFIKKGSYGDLHKFLLTNIIRKIIKSKISQVDYQAISVNLKKSHSTKYTKSNFPADDFKRIKQCF